MSQHRHFSAHFAEPDHSPNHSSNNHTSYISLTPQAKQEVRDPGSLTASQIEEDNAYFYGTDNAFPDPDATRLGRTGTEGMVRQHTVSSGTYNVDVYTFSTLPGSAGGTMITCPSDVAVKSLSGMGVEFEVKTMVNS